MENPLVSVCIPAYNAEKTLRRTLDSILVQDYPDFDVLVCDNQSTDSTAQIALEYATQKVRYVLNPVSAGWAEGNWNHVLSLAQGPLIALYHADDIYTPIRVRRQVEFLQAHPQASAVFTLMQRIDEQDRPIRLGQIRLPAELDGWDLFAFSEFLDAVLKYGTFTPVPTMMTRREVIDAVGVFRWQMCGTASDIDLYLRMARQWGPIGLIHEPLHLYRVSDQQGSMLIARNRTELADFFRALDAHLSDPDERQFAEPQALALYELQRANDQLLCAMNLLAQDKVAEARARLQQALQARHFVTALRRPRVLARLLVGACFWVSTFLGLGASLGRLVYRASQRRLQRRREPVG